MRDIFQGEGKSIDNLFLKMDIEGYERKVLKGAYFGAWTTDWWSVLYLSFA